jgi:hypothetical protein
MEFMWTPRIIRRIPIDKKANEFGMPRLHLEAAVETLPLSISILVFLGKALAYCRTVTEYQQENIRSAGGFCR